MERMVKREKFSVQWTGISKKAIGMILLTEVPLVYTSRPHRGSYFSHENVRASGVSLPHDRLHYYKNKIVQEKPVVCRCKQVGAASMPCLELGRAGLNREI
jgi:hypothetical protein